MSHFVLRAARFAAAIAVLAPLIAPVLGTYASGPPPCDEVQSKAHAAHRAATASKRATPASPIAALPADFRQSIQLAARAFGSPVEDAAFTATPHGRYAAVIFGGEETDSVAVLLFAPPGGRPTADNATLLWRAEQISFPDGAGSGFADRDGDGTKDLAIDVSYGGSCIGCDWTLVYAITPTGPVGIAASESVEFRDLDGDGIKECLVDDDRLASVTALPTSNRPAGVFVYKRIGTTYAFASPLYAGFYEKQIADESAGLRDAVDRYASGDDDAAEDLFEHAMNVYLAHLECGHPERAAETLDRLRRVELRRQDAKEQRDELIAGALDATRGGPHFADPLVFPRVGEERDPDAEPFDDAEGR